MADGYSLRISPKTVDKLGVKLYDKVSAVVAELIANGYDADAERVIVRLPVGRHLAKRVAEESGDDQLEDVSFIEVEDFGHGMNREEAQAYFLEVGRDRRAAGAALSRKKQRPVMGRKGIGKLAPFGICKRIEVISAGGERTKEGFSVSHFFLDYQEILEATTEVVPIKSGDLDGTFQDRSGTKIRLSGFQRKVVPARETLERQLARRFALAADDFAIEVEDSLTPGSTWSVPKFQVDLREGTRVDLADRPVVAEDGAELPVTGWLGMAKDAYQNEEMAGVRIYARGKIVATTRDFELAAGYTGEFTMRSYLVGEITAEWLDDDDGEDLVRTDRQGILWDSERGQALQSWGADLIKELGERWREKRGEGARKKFLEISNLKVKATARYGDKEVVDACVELGAAIGSRLSDDELASSIFVEGLIDIILSLGPQHALLTAFAQISNTEIHNAGDLLDIFNRVQIAELASLAQIGHRRVKTIDKLKEAIDNPGSSEADLQEIIAEAPWLVRPDWSLISENQGIKAFRDQLTTYLKRHYSIDVTVAVQHEKKRPDFTLVDVGNKLHVVEIKAPGHKFSNSDFDRLANYVEAMDALFDGSETIRSQFPQGWVIDLVTDGINIRDAQKKMLMKQWLGKEIEQVSWADFLMRARNAHEDFLNAHDRARNLG